ncbi:uncharacterized protein EV154DRAFT_402736, partial [Mucor mucedo]|uniref:uncharacterized protein n=1 Tax=Mucor mucedo TaxID=29922 RepID=UPI002220760F
LKSIYDFLKSTLYRKNKETDLSNCEIAKMGSGQIKLTTDRTKLFIESKITLDNIVKDSTVKAKDLMIPAHQFIGRNLSILYSICLVAPSLYVAVKEGITVIPNYVNHVKDFRGVLELQNKY